MKRARVSPRAFPLRSNLRAFCAARGGFPLPSPAYTEHAEKLLAHSEQHELIGTVDKNDKARFGWTERGYLDLSIRTIANESAYSWHFDVPLPVWARMKDQLYADMLPPQFVPNHPTQPKTLPYLYTNPKGTKCFVSGAHVCPKEDHQCSRVLCSQCTLPSSVLRAKGQTAKLAEALLHKRRQTHWQLWNLSQIRAALEEAVGGLVLIEEFEDVCPCGQIKTDALAMAQMDAAAFFTRSDNARGTSRFRLLCTEETASSGHKTGTIPSDKKQHAHLGGNPTNPPPRSNVLTFENAQKVFRHEAKDGFCAFGEVSMFRDDGWFMGSKLSTIATAVDLSRDEIEYHTTEEKRKKVGAYIPRLSPKETLAGLRMVDNVLLLSYIFCAFCLVRIAKKLYPRDVGMEEEPLAQPMAFLTAWLWARCRKLMMRPKNDNRPFALGHAQTAKVLRLGPHLDYFGSTSALSQYLSSRLAAQRFIHRDHPSLGWGATFELLLELLRLGFPLGLLEQQLAKFSGVRSSQMIDAARSLIRSHRRALPEFRHSSVPAPVLAALFGHPARVPPFPLKSNFRAHRWVSLDVHY